MTRRARPRGCPYVLAGVVALSGTVLSGCGLVHAWVDRTGTGRITGSASADGGPPGATVHVTGVVLRRDDGRRYVVRPPSANGTFSRDVPAGHYSVTALNVPQCSTTTSAVTATTVRVALDCQLK